MKRVARLILFALVGAASGCNDKSAQTPKEYAPPPSVGSSGGFKGGEPAAPPKLPKN
jgi:hypothetical protein